MTLAAAPCDADAKRGARAARNATMQPPAGFVAGAAERAVIAGDSRVLRGGSWNNNGRNARCANRNRNEPDNRNQNIGFRFAPAQASQVATLDQMTFLSAALRRQKANALRQAGRRRAERPPKRRLDGIC
ncbi:MAG: hypothetical protein DVS81_13600 [Candidatus Accumulibacter meliphilus]|uniref:Sulfatase-modifying factor enzyme-like domain-containing protein n=1 Tax=Candidatus Accumulibacter meliphilus TaxID=2211374 RepID=A0A369XNI7_9PROT|nr:MAG: hypothetical protein DVS81_13600 [Candidatus Accumulibacter meliphilus]